MILFVCALHAEAKPLIDYFRLKKQSGALDVYHAGEVALVVSGVGCMASAIATSHLLTRFEDALAVFNVGIAGSASQELAIGEMLLVHQVSSQDRGKDMYPDILFEHPWKEASLKSYGEPVEKSENPYATLVDMEGSGFFEAAIRFVSPHQVIVLKVVSDYLETKRPSKEQVSAWIEPHVRHIDALMEEIRSSLAIPPLFSAEEQSSLDTLIRQLRLTQTQQGQLSDLAKYCKLHHGNLDIVTSYLHHTATSPHERDQIFADLRSTLVC